MKDVVDLKIEASIIPRLIEVIIKITKKGIAGPTSVGKATVLQPKR